MGKKASHPIVMRHVNQFFKNDKYLQKFVGINNKVLTVVSSLQNYREHSLIYAMYFHVLVVYKEHIFCSKKKSLKKDLGKKSFCC